MNNKKFRNKEIVEEISKQTGFSKEVVLIVIKYFFIAIKKLFKKNKEVNIKGHIVFKLRKYYREKLEKKGPNVNLRPKENNKWKNVKKRYKLNYNDYRNNYNKNK